MTVRDEVQPDVVLEERFCASQHKGKSFRRTDRLLPGLRFAPWKTGIGNTDERRAVRSWTKVPLNWRGRIASGPFDLDSGVALNRFHVHWNRETVHPAGPCHLFACARFVTAFGEPKLRGERRIDKSLEHVPGRF